MRTETEMATRLLERDIHSKQDDIIALRNQLGEVKGYNIEVNSKLQVPVLLVHPVWTLLLY